MSTYTVQQAKEEIKASIGVYLKKKEDGSYRMPEVNRLPFYLVGAPGVGKTEMAQQIAQELGIGFASLSITHHTRNTVLGLPIIREISDAQKTSYTEYTMSEMIAMVEKKVAEGYPEGILLVDEFACMAESLVAPMLAFLQTKNIGSHQLPQGWILILCSNPARYNRSARTFDMAVMDRVRLMEIVFDTGEFLRYGAEHGFHEDILGYLKLFPQDAHLCKTAENGERTIVTTRGWENLSWCLQGYEEAGRQVESALIGQFIKSEEISRRFYQFYLTNHTGLKIKEIDEILSGENISRYIDRMAKKEYAVRFQTMRLFGNVFAEEGKEVGEQTDFLLYLEGLAESWKEQEAGAAAESIERRLAGEDIAPEHLRRALDDREREAWEEIRGLAQEKPCWTEAIDAYRQQKATALRRSQKKISERISNACSFLAAIEGQDNLMDPFINLLNQSKGILDVVAAVKNPTYLKYSRRAYGTDGFLKRTAEQVG